MAVPTAAAVLNRRKGAACLGLWMVNIGQLFLLVLLYNSSLGWRRSWEENGAGKSSGVIRLGTLVGHSFTQLHWDGQGAAGRRVVLP